jgi:hypothetical protein
MARQQFGFAPLALAGGGDGLRAGEQEVSSEVNQQPSRLPAGALLLLEKVHYAGAQLNGKSSPGKHFP